MELDLHSDDHFMREALKQAEMGFNEKEIPVGAVVVCNNKIIARAHNQIEKLNDSTAHAEMIAVTAAFNYLGSKYLPDCSIYVTLEPCIMCAGALFWAQIGKLFYGSPDAKRGFRTSNGQILHPKTKVFDGILSEECKQILDKFFINIRNVNKNYY
jgi:tRNA(adenine34) deaminase